MEQGQTDSPKRGRGRPKGVLNEPNPEIEARNDAIEALFLAGHTLQQIGDVFGITRERVRQIRERRGLQGQDGGKFLAWSEAALARTEAREARCQARYGCSCEEYNEIRRVGKDMLARGIGRYHTPLYAWRMQKHTYRLKHVPYELTLWDFWTLWRDSGHWEDRGQGKYGLCRKDTSKGFTRDNVFVRKMNRETGWGEKVGGAASKFKPIRETQDNSPVSIFAKYLRR